MDERVDFYVLTFVVSFLGVVFLGFMDVVGRVFVKGIANYTEVQPMYMMFFWFFALGLGAMMSVFYMLITRDVSAGIGSFLGYLILAATGLEDIFHFVFLHLGHFVGVIPDGVWMPESFIPANPGLMGHFLFGSVARWLGLEAVSWHVFAVTIPVGIILGWVVAELFFRLEYNLPFTDWEL